MTPRLEATGGPAACARCGRRAPEQDDPRWAGRLERGRLVALVCPDCLEPAERAEIGARGRAELYEVVSGRRATPAELSGACPPAWLGALDAGEAPVGIAVEGEDEGGGTIDVVWVGRRGGAPTACLASVPLAAWAAFEEVYVPPAARDLARRLVA